MRQDKKFSHDGNSTVGRESFKELVLRDSEIVKPILKERFLTDYIFGMGDPEESFRLYCSAFCVDGGTSVQVILFKVKGNCGNEDKAYLRNTAECFFDNKDIILSTYYPGGVILIVKDTGEKDMMSVLGHAVSYISKNYEMDVFAVYSRPEPISDIPEIYNRLRRCTEYSFYSETIRVMCETSAKHAADAEVPKLEYTGIEKAVSTGDEKETERLTERFFSAIEEYRPAPAVAKIYCLEFYVCLIRCCAIEKMDTYMKGIVSIQKSDSYERIKAYIKAAEKEIVRINAPEPVVIYSSLIKDTMRIIDENIGNEKLSLRWIAGTILYTNVDYLGKTFKKETGRNFSHYVMEKRMELAKKLIVGGEKDRIYEVAEKVGYGTNSQYFSQVFKKYTGISPLEYKEITRLSKK